MKNNFLKFLFLVIIGVTSTINAQQIEIEGTISDDMGNSLLDATVQVKGTTKGVSSDYDGHYLINANVGEILIFSYVGFITKEVAINGQTTINVSLTPDAVALDEVVIGYGTVRKKDLTGSITTLSTKNFNKGPVTGVENLIQGRAPGVQISAESSEPGGQMLIRIRGNNSINSNNSPLYVVDGFPLETLDNSINPSDIESVNILKDASATAIYGTRGANGVVIITTKRGKEGKSSITYSGNYSVHNADLSAYDFLNSNDYANIHNELANLYGNEPVYSESAINRVNELGLQTDWLEEVFRTGTTNEHQLSISGGNENTKAFFSTGMYLWDGVIQNTSFDRYNMRLNVDQNLMDGKLKLGVNSSLSSTESDFLGFDGSSMQDNILRGIFRANPIVPTSDVWDNLSEADKHLIFADVRPVNPIQTLEIADNKSSKYFVLTNAFLELTIAKDFKFKTEGGVRVTNQKIRRFLPSTSRLVASSVEVGAATLNHGLFKYYTFENTLNYDKIIDRHSINVIIGTTHEWSDNESFTAGAKDFTTDALGYNNLQSGATPLTPESYVSHSELISYLSRVNYSFDDRYLFTFTFRRDGSTKFGEGNKWGNFPAGAFAWKVHNESFFNSNSISSLKLRGSLGITGSDRFPVGQGQSIFSPTAPVTTNGTDVSIGTVSSRVGNSDLKWEETRKIDIGIEMGFFDNKLTMEIAGYQNNTSNLLLQKSLAPSLGVSSILTNAGEVQNRGIEFSANYNYYSKDSDFSWSSDFTFAYNDNEIIELNLPGGTTFLPGPETKIDGGVDGSFTILKEGLPVNAIYGYRFLGILQPGEVYDPQPNAQPGDALFKDINGDGVFNVDDKEVLGNGYPAYTFGFNNSFSYKNFSLSVFFAGVFDVDKLNGNNVLGYKDNTLEIAKERWTPYNLDGTLPQKHWLGDEWINDYFIEEASYIRMKNISLAYNFDANTLDKMGLSIFQINITGLNLLTWDSYSGFDPEVNSKRSSTTNLNVAAGLDAYAYPYQRTFSVGLKIGI
ncbi:MAG: TonB-dependent receptor [Bacteroidota bacterium]